jgi:uncharacterized protein (DUF58 family)
VLVSTDTALPRTIDELIGRDLAAALDRLDVLTTKMFAGKLPGERRSKRRGRSVEFDDFRDYIPGDDLRHVDWNVLARLDKLFIKLFREDEDLSVHVFVDCSASMDSGTPSKLVFAARLAAAIGYVGLVRQNRVALTVFSPQSGRVIRQLTAARGRPSVQRLGRFLLDALDERRLSSLDSGLSGSVDAPRADFNAALKAAAASRAGRGVMVVLSDFLLREGYIPGLNALFGTGASNFETHCIQILAPAEIDPRRAPDQRLRGDLRLTDVEHALGVDVTLSPALIDRYLKALGGHNDALRAECRARGMTYHRVASDAPVDRFVRQELRRGGLFR